MCCEVLIEVRSVFWERKVFVIGGAVDIFFIRFSVIFIRFSVIFICFSVRFSERRRYGGIVGEVYI